jgi:hypothetical protein
MRFESSSMNFLYSSPPRKNPVQPSFSSVSFHALVSVASLTSLTSASRCGGVMPGAPKMPRQLPSSTSTPCSLSEAMPSVFAGEETASARILPALICSANSPSPETPAVTWPPMIAATASPPPL